MILFIQTLIVSLLNKMHLKFIIVIFAFGACGVQSARILGFFPIPSISHQVIFQPIWKELSLRGHELTVLTPNPLKDPKLVNLTEIDVNYMYDNFDIQNIMSKDKTAFQSTRDVLLYNLNNIIPKEVMDPEFQKVLKRDKNYFDLILVEAHNRINVGLGGVFNAPIIVVSSLNALVHDHDALGNPTHPVLYPEMMLGYDQHQSFFQRWNSFFFNIAYRISMKYDQLPKANVMAKKLFGNIPDLEELSKNISMMFLNINPVLFPVRPNVPGVIEMCQMNIKPIKQLPKDLQKLLDDSEGVVYFSLGTNVKSVNLTESLRNSIIGALSELPYTILWKWEADHLPGQSQNIHTRKWFPQLDVLAHPNLKAFVTQGGLQSIEEAISSGVPLVGMPMIADQPMNVKKVVNAGLGVSVDSNTLTKEKLKNAIVEVIENKKYKAKMEKAKSILQDQPMTGLQKAVWWSEYVIRHKGARHLRSPALDLPLYQYVLIDVVAASLFVIFLIFYVIYKIFTLLFVQKEKKFKKKIK